jgi:hypothetical protein
MTLNDILNSLQGINFEDDKIKSEVEKIISNGFAGLIKELDTLKVELSKKDEVINELKGKSESKSELETQLREILGLDSNTPINIELIKSKLNSKKDDNLKEIEEKYNEIINNLNKQILELEQRLESEVSQYSSKVKDLELNNKISTVLPNLNIQEGAMEDVLRYLKENATLNDKGEIIYKEGDIILRDNKGQELTLQGKIEQLMETKKYLFKSDVKQGGGLNHFGSGGSNGNLTDFGSKLLQRARTKGLNINL